MPIRWLDKTPVEWTQIGTAVKYDHRCVRDNRMKSRVAVCRPISFNGCTPKGSRRRRALETTWWVLLILRVTEKVILVIRHNIWWTNLCWKVTLRTYLWLIVRVCLQPSSLSTKLARLHNLFQKDRLLWANSLPDLVEETSVPPSTIS